MAEIGEKNRLTVTRVEGTRVSLDGGALGRLPLVRGKDPRTFTVGQVLDLFVYQDGEGKPVATTTMPRVMPGQFGWLEVVSVTGVGAFLDWGLSKDLLVPFREQQTPLEVGRSYLVHVHTEGQGERFIASSRVERFISLEEPPYAGGQEVDLLVAGRTDLGYKAIVEDAHWGLLFHNEVQGTLRPGQRLRGYIKQVRADGKIDLSLHRPGNVSIGDEAAAVLDALERAGGSLPVGDKSPPGRIREMFGLSKKAFKKVVGNLYRRRLISLEPERIQLVDDGGDSG